MTLQHGFLLDAKGMDLNSTALYHARMEPWMRLKGYRWNQVNQETFVLLFSSRGLPTLALHTSALSTACLMTWFSFRRAKMSKLVLSRAYFSCGQMLETVLSVSSRLTMLLGMRKETGLCEDGFDMF